MERFNVWLLIGYFLLFFELMYRLRQVVKLYISESVVVKIVLKFEFQLSYNVCLEDYKMFILLKSLNVRK